MAYIFQTFILATFISITPLTTTAKIVIVKEASPLEAFYIKLANQHGIQISGYDFYEISKIEESVKETVQRERLSRKFDTSAYELQLLKEKIWQYFAAEKGKILNPELDASADDLQMLKEKKGQKFVYKNGQWLSDEDGRCLSDKPKKEPTQSINQQNISKSNSRPVCDLNVAQKAFDLQGEELDKALAAQYREAKRRTLDTNFNKNIRLVVFNYLIMNKNNLFLASPEDETGALANLAECIKQAGEAAEDFKLQQEKQQTSYPYRLSGSSVQ